MRFLLMLAVLYPFNGYGETPEKKAEYRLQKRFYRYAQRADKLEAERMKITQDWEAMCLGRRLIMGFDVMNRPSCKTPDPPKPEPVKPKGGTTK